jgi:integrase
VFRGEKGGPLRRHVVQKHWTRARSTVDLPARFRFHDLRHTANTLTAAAGASTRDLMHRMGHASAQAALRYQHATRQRDAEIAKSLGELIEAATATSPRDGRGMEPLDGDLDNGQAFEIEP